MTVESDQVISPFPGLRSFEPGEVDLFFGREEQVIELLSRLQHSRFIGILGPSGSGKSSLVRAGLLPLLHGGFMAGSDWRIAIFRPSGDPVVNLARALGRPAVLSHPEAGDFAKMQNIIIETTLRSSAIKGLVDVVEQARLPEDENLLIVVDQFEELFRYKHLKDPEHALEEATLFTQLLINASHQKEVPIYVAITMRSDFLGDCTKFPNLAETINEGMYLIPRMNREQRRRAITGPVGVVGAEMAPRLVIQLLNDVGDNPDQLPILQHALMRTWDYWCDQRQDSEPLDLHHYEEIGGMAGALDQHAEEAYKELSDDHKAIAEVLFKRLTYEGSGAQGVRWPTSIQEISDVARVSVEEVITVAECFRTQGRTFLMPPEGEELQADTKLDISHESLMRVWKRLIKWVKEEAESERMYLDLAALNERYQKGKRLVLVTPELELYLNWRKKQRPNEAWALRYHPNFKGAMSYLDHSAREHKHKLGLENEERRLKLKWANRRTVLFGVVAIVILVLALLAINQLGKIKDLRLNAESFETRVNTAKTQAERSMIQADTAKAEARRDSILANTAKAEARRSIIQADTAKAEAERDSFLAALAKVEADTAKAEAGRAKVEAHTARARARRDSILAASAKDRVKAAEAAADRFSLSFAARRLAIMSSNRQRGRLTDLLVLQAFNFQKENEESTQVPYLYDALRHAIGPREEDVVLSHEDQVRAVAYSPGGSFLASTSEDGAVWLWNVHAATSVEFEAPKDPARIRSLAFSPDSDLLAAGTVEGRVLIWKIADPHEQPADVAGHSAIVQYVAFDSLGQILYTADLNGVVKAWDPRTDPVQPSSWLGEQGRLFSTQHATPARVTAFAFIPERLQMLVGAGGVLHLWYLTADSSVVIGSLGSEILSITSQSDRVAVGTEEGEIYLFSLTEGGPAEVLRGHNTGVTDLVFHPKDEGILVSGSLDNTVGMWNINKPQDDPIRLTDHQAWVWSVAFSPDGNTLVSASADGQVRRWTVHADSLAGQIKEKRPGDELTKCEWYEFVGEDIPYKGEDKSEEPCQSDDTKN